jgi:hypothetical protein
MVEEGARRRVVVEVCNARNLMPKDGQGTACAYAVVDFDGQRRRTATRPRDLNPQWGERLEFLVHSPGAMSAETLELNVYNDKKAIAGSGGGGGRKSGGTFLGKVKVAGASFAKEGDETLVYYPLEKRSVFSQIKGEIGLKIWFVDEPPPAPPAADEKADAPSSEKKDATEETAAAAPAASAEEKKPDAAPAEEKKAEEAAKPEDKKPEKGGKKKSPEKGKKDGEKPKEEGKAKEEKKEVVAAAAPASPSKAPPPSPSKMQLATAGVAGDLEIRPQTAAERSMAASGGGSASYDLVDRVPYLFVRLLKAKHHGDGGGKQPLYAQLCIGAHTVRTRAAASAGEWDQVFAFHKASLTASSLEVTVHEEAKKPEKEGEPTPEDANLGFVSFDLQEVPKRSPPDSALAPQWYTLEGHAEDGAARCPGVQDRPHCPRQRGCWRVQPELERGSAVRRRRAVRSFLDRRSGGRLLRAAGRPGARAVVLCAPAF